MVKKTPRAFATTFAANIVDVNLRAVIRDNFEELCDTIPAALRSLKNRMDLQKSYNTFVELAFPDLVGQEFIDTPQHPLKNRACEFLNQRVHTSRSRAYEGKQMSFKSLLTLRFTFLAILFDNVPGIDRVQWTDMSYQWCKGFQRQYRLPSIPMDRMVFGVHEVLLLIEEAFTNPVCWDNALQHVCAMLMQFLFGPRPSSLFVCAPYKNFLALKAILLRRTSIRGLLDIEFELNTFKGHGENRIQITYTVRPPSQLRNIALYLAGYTGVVGVRRNEIIGCPTIDDLWDGKTDLIEWANPELPFFRAAGPGGRTVTLEPMSDHGATNFLHKIAAGVGINGKGGKQLGASPYSFRTNFVTKLTKASNLSVARVAMGHRPGSNTIMESYDNGNHRLDFFGIATDEAVEDNVQEGRNPAVYRAPVQVPRLSIAELVKRQPMLAIFFKQAQNLQSCLALGGNVGWKNLVYTSDLIEETDTPETIFKWTLARIKKLSQTTRIAYANEVQRAASKDVRKTITFAERQRRAEEVGEGSTRLEEILKQARDRMMEGDEPAKVVREVDDGDDADDSNNTVRVAVAEPDEEEEEEEEEEQNKDDNTPEKVAKAMIKMMGTLAVMKDPAREARLCSECRDDPTATNQDIQKDWGSDAHLTRHIDSFHSQDRRVTRFLEACGARYVDPVTETVSWLCDWCGDIHHDQSSDADDADGEESRQGMNAADETDGRGEDGENGEAEEEAKATRGQGDDDDDCIDADTSSTDEENSDNGTPTRRKSKKFSSKKALIQHIVANHTYEELEVEEYGMMQLIVEAEEALICTECRDDPSIPENKRNITFANPSGQIGHMKTKKHDPDVRAIRMAKMDSSVKTRIRKGRCQCPYCEVFTGETIHSLCEHIVNECGDELDSDVYEIYERVVREAATATPFCLSPEKRLEVVRRMMTHLQENPETKGAFGDEWAGDYSGGFRDGGLDAEEDTVMEDAVGLWGAEQSLDNDRAVWGAAGDVQMD